jgi:hypothetical protein
VNTGISLTLPRRRARDDVRPSLRVAGTAAVIVLGLTFARDIAHVSAGAVVFADRHPMLPALLLPVSSFALVLALALAVRLNWREGRALTDR